MYNFLFAKKSFLYIIFMFLYIIDLIMLVPFYAPRDPKKTYKDNDYEWIDLSVFLNILNDEVINDFKDLSAFKLDDLDDSNWKLILSKYWPVNIKWDNFVDFSTFMIASKVFYTTWFTCKYWLWKKWELTDYGYPHHGIDLILPYWTPIESFTDAEVYSVKKWDGVTKNAWNCLVLKSNDLYFCYEHLDIINVKKWDIIKKWDQIWTVGKTWNATTYHLHFQIDQDNAPFHPYWWKWELDIQKTYEYCIDPWSWLRENYIKVDKTLKTKNNLDKKVVKKESKIILASTTNHKQSKDKTINEETINKETINEEKINKEKKDQWKLDLVDSLSNYLTWMNTNQNYIKFFINAWILKWDHWNYLLDTTLTRYQITLILYRLKKVWLLSLKDKTCLVSFKDISELKEDEEFMKSLQFVVCNNILNGDNGYFLANNKLTWIQFLAIIWRLFGKLKNGNNIWYSPYKKWAEDNGYITDDWAFFDKPILRDEVFKILYKIFNVNIK